MNDNDSKKIVNDTQFLDEFYDIRWLMNVERDDRKGLLQSQGAILTQKKCVSENQAGTFLLIHAGKHWEVLL